MKNDSSKSSDPVNEDETKMSSAIGLSSPTGNNCVLSYTPAELM